MPFLRKKRRSTVGAPMRSELGHSLSLPDLTTPLIDEASWEELPAFAKFIPQLSNTIGKGNGATVKQHTIGIVTADHPVQNAYANDDFAAPTSTLPRVSSVSREPITPRQSATIGHGAVAGTTPYTYASPSRNRSPSLISAKGGPGSPIAFHRPFRGDNVFSPPQTAPPVPGYGHGFPHGADFRKSAAGWSMHGRGIGEEGDGYSTIGSVRPHSMAPGRKKRGKGKVVQERLNVVVAGGRGSGKTSLIRLLSSEPPSEPIHSLLTSQAAGPATTVAPPSFSPDQTPSSPTSAGPPLPSLAAPLVPSKRLSAALPRLTEPAPTRSLSAYQALIQQPRLQRALAVRFIDTPGLDVQTDDGPAVHAYTRERGVMALLGMVEGQCEAVLREESKVSRKGTAGADELVHLCLYLIDARRVLHPDTQAIEPDWGFQGLFVSDDDPLSRTKSAETKATARPMSTMDVKPHIPEADMQTIRSLRKRVTVLPILTYSDTLSTIELARVRDAVRRDMAAAFADEEGGGFGLFGVSDDVAEPESPILITSPEGPHDPPTPALTESSIVVEQEMPYALFCPSGISATTPSVPVHGLGLGDIGASPGQAGTMEASTKREFAWGSVDVWNGEHSDLGKLRESIFEINPRALKNHTRQVIYEKFRTERLLAHRARRGIAEGAESE